MRRINFMKTAAAGAASQQGSRHLRRAEEAKAKKLSIPAAKKIIRRNNQRKGK